MAHQATSMAGVEDPSERLGEIIGGVDDPGDVTHFDIASFLPILNCKELYIDVPRAIGGHVGVDHIDSREIVFKYQGRVRLTKTELS